MFDINFISLLLMIIPEYLWFQIILSLGKIYISPVQILYYDFMTKRKNDRYILSYNSQVCYMRAALNNRFDNTLRRIIIRDGNSFNHLYIYISGELKPKYLPLFDRTVGEYNGLFDFIVVIPAALNGIVNNDQIKSEVDFYRLASKRYRIVYE